MTIRVIDHIKKLDWILIGSAFFLFLIGLISVYSSASDGLGSVKKQIIFLIVGIVAMIVVSSFDWMALKENSSLVLFLYSIGVVLLVGLFFFAPVIRSVRRWYVIGPFSFDPIVFVKIVLIILLAKYFSSRHIEMYKFSHIIFSGIYVAIPIIITLFQPDLGSAIILTALWVGILIFSGIKLKHFMVLVIIGIIIMGSGWVFVMRDYQRERVIAFLEPRMDPQGINWHPEQAKIAIGSGGFWGRGIGRGSQTQQGFLPEPETDFIFSAIAEEMGLIGVSLIFLFFSIFISRILKIAKRSRNNFSRLFCSGFVIIILAQVLVNIGMNLRLLPIVGIPLPFVSYGGSNLVFTFITIGIVQRIRVMSE